MDADVIVIGAGICGALVADRLAATGVKVLMLEAGPRIDREHAVVQFFNAAIKVPECGYPNTAYAPHPRSEDPDFYYVQSGPDKFKSTYVRQVGGTTWHWLGTCLRLVPDDFRLATRFRRGVDWPIDYSTLEPWYGRAEDAIGVAGDSSADLGSPRSSPYPMPRIAPSYLDATVAKAFEGSGFDVHPPVYGVEPPHLVFGQSQLARNIERVARAGIAVEFGRLGEPHPLAVPQCGDVVVGQRLNVPNLLPGRGQFPLLGDGSRHRDAERGDDGKRHEPAGHGLILRE